MKTKLKTTNIRGKEYVEVHTRIQYFRENFKDWALTSDIERLEFITIDDKEYLMCVMKSVVKNPDGIVKSTGTAYEILGSSNVNKTSFIENCETSANGRALGNLGIGIDTSIASADEVKIAIQSSNKTETKIKLTKDIYEAMLKACKDGNGDVVEMRMSKYSMTKEQENNLKKCIKSSPVQLTKEIKNKTKTKKK
tara:strand:- start:2042 stop:2626 length:585 start_codon:yes stop_codon:yes gene_type:complete